MFRGFLSKMECKTQCLFCNLNNFLAIKIILAKRVSDRWFVLARHFWHSPDERESANVTPWLPWPWMNKTGWFKDKSWNFKQGFRNSLTWFQICWLFPGIEKNLIFLDLIFSVHGNLQLIMSDVHNYGAKLWFIFYHNKVQNIIHYFWWNMEFIRSTCRSLLKLGQSQ